MCGKPQISFGDEARKGITDGEDGFRRHQLQALVQRVEPGTDEIRIGRLKPKLIQTLTASGGNSGVEPARAIAASFRNRSRF